MLKPRNVVVNDGSRELSFEEDVRQLPLHYGKGRQEILPGEDWEYFLAERENLPEQGPGKVWCILFTVLSPVFMDTFRVPRQDGILQGGERSHSREGKFSNLFKGIFHVFTYSI
jgi:hypothetical protein